MSSIVLTDCTCWVGGYDFTTDSNQIGISIGVEDLESTTFGSGGYRSRVGGLKTVESSLSGFWQSAATDAVDPQAFTNLGTADRSCTVAPDDAETTPAYLYQAGFFSYNMFGEVGALAPFELNSMGTNGVGVARGQIAKARGNVSATGVLGSAVQLGNVASDKYLYATLHVFSAGTTITVLVESDDSAGFGSATTQMTLGPITTQGGTWGVRVAGPLTETHYRFRVSAITGTFNVAGAIGIG